MENTDFNVAQANPTFQKLAKEGIALSEYYGCAHPSEENYLCSCTGDIWGLNSDNFFHLPAKFV
jgi:acid phosphatase